MIYVIKYTQCPQRKHTKLFAKINLLPQIIAPQKLLVYLLGRYVSTTFSCINFDIVTFQMDIIVQPVNINKEKKS